MRQNWRYDEISCEKYTNIIWKQFFRANICFGLLLLLLVVNYTYGFTIDYDVEMSTLRVDGFYAFFFFVCVSSTIFFFIVRPGILPYNTHLRLQSITIFIFICINICSCDIILNILNLTVFLSVSFIQLETCGILSKLVAVTIFFLRDPSSLCYKKKECWFSSCVHKMGFNEYAISLSEIQK